MALPETKKDRKGWQRIPGINSGNLTGWRWTLRSAWECRDARGRCLIRTPWAEAARGSGFPGGACDLG